MDLAAKIRTLPVSAGVYLYKNAEGQVIYVGKANNLRSRVSSYFHEGRVEDAKTGSLIRCDRIAGFCFIHKSCTGPLYYPIDSYAPLT